MISLVGSSVAYHNMFRHRLAISAPMLVMATLSTVTQCFSATAPVFHSVKIPPETAQAIDQLQPESLWNQFAILSSIPRPSKQEDAVLQYIKEFCDKHSLEWKQDAVGNLAVFHPGTGTGKEAPPVIVQGHLDMVTEKNQATEHNFETDPILLRRFSKNKEHWLGAQGTTLGADNGIGVAATLALLETPVDSTEVILPPLQALFTVDEETGLTGATELDAQALGLTGKVIMNLDTEEWGELYVGCSGGGESTLTLPLSRITSTEESSLVELRVEGLLGGHSGLNIHEGRANAILLCAGATHAALQHEGVELVSLSGGDKHNAIPREARAILKISKQNEAEARAALEQILHSCHVAAMDEFGLLETNMRMTLNDNSHPASEPLDKTTTSRLLSVLLALPHGPIKFSHAMPDLVETSNNVASLAMDEATATILCSTRSSINTALEATRNKLAAIASLSGATIERSPPYPGWNPNMQSELLQVARRILQDRLDRKPGVKAIHAGLECGLLIEKLGGSVDALSFGPTIEGAHSPDECICVDTVPPFFELVKDILAELAGKRET